MNYSFALQFRSKSEWEKTFLCQNLLLILTMLANLNEQAQSRYRHLVRQMAENEGITEDLKRQSQWVWVKAMNSVASRAEEIIKSEMINV